MNYDFDSLSMRIAHSNDPDFFLRMNRAAIKAISTVLGVDVEQLSDDLLAAWRSYQEDING